MTRYYYALYCTFSGDYLYEEREDCWQYTNLEDATRIPDLCTARRIKQNLKEEGFTHTVILKMKETTKIIKKIEDKRSKKQ